MLLKWFLKLNESNKKTIVYPVVTGWFSNNVVHILQVYIYIYKHVYRVMDEQTVELNKIAYLHNLWIVEAGYMLPQILIKTIEYFDSFINEWVNIFLFSF